MSIIIMFRKHLFMSESEKNDRMKIHHLFIAAASAAALLAGCAGADARRQQRWAAFEPLRPAPEFRLLPDRPLLKFHRTAGTVPADSKLGEVYSEPPHVWKSEKLDLRGIETTSSKFFPDHFALYVIPKTGFTGKLRVCALNAKMEEIGRASAPVDLQPGEAGWITFQFPESFGINEVKVLSLEIAE